MRLGWFRLPNADRNRTSRYNLKSRQSFGSCPPRTSESPSTPWVVEEDTSIKLAGRVPLSRPKGTKPRRSYIEYRTSSPGSSLPRIMPHVRRSPEAWDTTDCLLLLRHGRDIMEEDHKTPSLSSSNISDSSSFALASNIAHRTYPIRTSTSPLPPILSILTAYVDCFECKQLLCSTA